MSNERLATEIVSTSDIRATFPHRESLPGGEADLRESEERYRSLVELSPDAILILEQTRIVYGNSAATTLFGATTAEELLGKSVRDFLDGAERVSAEERIGAVLATGRPAPPRRYHVQRLDGRSIEVESRGGRCVFQGRPAVQVVVRDVTERRQMEASLRRNEAHLRAIIDNEPECLKLITTDGILLEMNGAGLAMIEADRVDSVLGKCIFELIAPEHRARFHSMCQRVADGKKERLEFEIIGLRGTRRWMQSHGVRLPPNDTDPPILMFLTRDITDSKRAVEALRVSEERYRLLVETSPHAIVVTDLQARLTYCNQQMARLIGWERPEELVGCDGLELLAPADRTRGREVMQVLMAEGRVRDTEFSLLRRDGSDCQVEVSAAAITDAQGKATGFMAVLHDITERKRADDERRRFESQIQQAQKLKSIGVLAGGIAHDFNNLLTPILCCTGMALQALPSGSSAGPLLEEVERAARRAAELVAQMLAYAGKGKFLITAMDVTALVEEMVQLLRVSISRKAELHLDLTPHLPTVVGDAAQIRQVVMNLITNASDALGDAPGRITIRTYRCPRQQALALQEFASGATSSDCVVVEVTDTGCGMTPETQARIFEPFFTTKFTGRGLGLAAVQGIVRSHHGVLSVDSEPGRGSTFRMVLPCRPEAPAAVAAPPAARPWRGAGAVLVVEDEESLRRLSRTILSQAGFDVVEAVDGRQGIDIFRAAPTQFAVVLLDLTMPQMGGLETLEQIRAIAPHVPVILMSGYSENDVAQLVQGKHLTGYLNKPFQEAELLQAIRKALATAPSR